MAESHDYLVHIPQGVPVRQFPLRREFYEVKMNYDLWPVLFQQWELSLQKSRDMDNSEEAFKYFKEEIEAISSFISQVLIINPSRVEDLNTELGPVIFERNLGSTVTLLLNSLSQIKNLEQTLRGEREHKIESTLRSISMIISAIASLYSQPSYRLIISQCLSLFEKSLIDTEKPYGSTYSMHTTSSHNRLIYLLKELNSLEWSYLKGHSLVTIAISKLGPCIMSDPHPPSNILQLLDVIKDLKFKMGKDNLEIYLNLLETYKQALLKFRT